MTARTSTSSDPSFAERPPIDAVVDPVYSDSPPSSITTYEYRQREDAGGGMSVKEGVGIATSLLPLVALFAGNRGKSRAAPVRRPVVHARPVKTAETGLSQQSKMLLLGGGAFLILAGGIFLLSRD